MCRIENCTNLKLVVNINYGWKIIIMEYLEGFDKIAANEIAMTQQAVFMAMNTLHKNGLVHGDLHAANIKWQKLFPRRSD